MSFIIVSNFLESFKFYLILYFGFEEKIRKKKNRNFFISSLLIFVSCVCEYFIKDTDKLEYFILKFISFFIIIIMSAYVLFEANIIKTFLMIGWITCIINLCDSLSLFLIRVIYAINKMNYYDNKITYLVDIVTLIILFVTYQIIFERKKYSLKEIRISKLVNIMIISICYFFILSIVWTVYVSQIENEGHRSGMYIIFIFLVIAAFYHLIITMKYAIVNEKLIEINAKNSSLLFLQEQQYSYANQVDIETKKFRHDIKSHLLILSSLFTEGKWKEADEYLEQINHKISNISPSHYVNHSIGDAIIRQFEAQCREKKIHFKVKGYFPENCKLEHYDITTILTNILQNAFEAVVSEEIKEIILELKYDEKFIYILEENTFDGGLLEKEGRFVTSKANKTIHGFGVSNIKESVKKYGGEYFYEIIEDTFKNHRFQLSIVIPSKEKF